MDLAPGLPPALMVVVWSAVKLQRVEAALAVAVEQEMSLILLIQRLVEMTVQQVAESLVEEQAVLGAEALLAHP